MQPFYYRLWGKENCISLYTSYALKNEESFWITVNVDEIKDTTDYCIQRISMKIKVDLKTYVLLLRLTLSVVDFFLSIPFYKWDEILYIAWDLQCTKPYYWSLSKNWMFLTDTVILFWNISICSSWKEASKDQKGVFQEIILRSCLTREEIHLIQKCIFT